MGSYQTLNIDEDNNLWLAYQDSHDKALHVLKFNGFNWISTNVSYIGVSDGEARWISLAINPVNGIPYIGFQDVDQGLQSSVMLYDNNSTWKYLGARGMNSSSGGKFHQSLAIDASGNPYLAYYVGSAGYDGSGFSYYDPQTAAWSRYTTGRSLSYSGGGGMITKV